MGIGVHGNHASLNAFLLDAVNIARRTDDSLALVALFHPVGTIEHTHRIAGGRRSVLEAGEQDIRQDRELRLLVNRAV